MTEEKVRQVMMSVQDKIPQDKVMLLKSKLETADDSKVEQLLYTPLHNPTHVMLYSIFLGGLGVDRFMIGDTGLGAGKLLLGWLTCGIWPLLDIFMSPKSAKEKNFNTLMSLL